MCRAQDPLTEIPLFRILFISPLFDAATRPIPVEDHFRSWILVVGFLCAVSRTTDDHSPHFWLKILLSIVVALQSSPNHSDVCNSYYAARPCTVVLEKVRVAIYVLVHEQSLVFIVINPNQPRMRARGKTVDEPMEQRAIVASMTSSRWLPQPYHKTRQQVETQRCRSRLPSVSAANEEDETSSYGRKWSLHRRERGRPGMQLRAPNQLTKGQCAFGPRRRFGLVLWWRHSAAARVGRWLLRIGRAGHFDRRPKARSTGLRYGKRGPSSLGSNEKSGRTQEHCYEKTARDVEGFK